MPFAISTGGDLAVDVKPFLVCQGPWLRSSSPLDLTPGLDEHRWYCADDTVFSIYGDVWRCTVTHNISFDDFEAEVTFCLAPSDPAEIDLAFDGTNLTANADDSTCGSASAAGFLGHTQARDGDVFDFAGTAGERVRVTLARDGAAGGNGATATLEARSKAGHSLARRTGQLPLTVDVALADAGLVLAVDEAGAGQGDPYRGGYLLSVRPASSDGGGRLLRPRPNVEP